MTRFHETFLMTIAMAIAWVIFGWAILFAAFIALAVMSVVFYYKP